MLNDSDTQAKRILLWQQVLTSLSPEERQAIEEDPFCQVAKECASAVERALEEWQKQRGD